MWQALKEQGKGRICAPEFLMRATQALTVFVPHTSLFMSLQSKLIVGITFFSDRLTNL